jgi:hypothetical protein
LALAQQTEAGRRARLRIYVDDDPRAALDMQLSEAAAPAPAADAIFAPPFGAGSARRIAWYYPIAFREKLIVALDELAPDDGVYYHFDVLQTEPQPIELVSESEHELRALAVSQLQFARRMETSPELVPARVLRLASGALEQLNVPGSATIRSFEVRTPVTELERLRDVRVRMFWDQQIHPAIDLSLRDLFGTGEEVPEVSSAALWSEREGAEQLLALRLPMPFADGARIELENGVASEVGLQVRLLGERGIREGAGHLHAQLRETRGPSELPEHVALDARGRGRAVGVCAHVQGHADSALGFHSHPLNLLEGDVRATIDGRLALDGTGSEEYADDLLYFLDAPHGNAFAQVWGVRDGRASFCRWHVLGGELDFAEFIRLGIERGGVRNPSIADLHRTVAFFYLSPQ